MDQRQTHSQVRREDLSPKHPVHGRAKPQRRLQLYRRDDPAPLLACGHGELLCRLDARLSGQRHTVEPGDLVGRIRHVLARPRVGVAWRPFGDHTVLRGGYGVFYEAEGTSGRLNFNFLPFSLSEGVNATANVVPTRTLANYFLGVPFGASLGAVGWTPLPLEADMGYDQRWNVGIQQELAGRMSVELNYVGTKGSNQQQAEPINIPDPGPGNIQARRPYPRFGNLNIHSQALSSE